MTTNTAPPRTPGNYDFGLNALQEARAAQLHRESIVFDLLSQHVGGNVFDAYPPELRQEFKDRQRQVGGGFQGLAEALYWPYEMSLSGRSDLIRDWYRESGLTCGTYGIPVYDGVDPVWIKWESLTSRYANLPWLRYVTTAAEIRRAKRDGVIAFYGHWQSQTPLPRNLAVIDKAHSKGLRSFMLTYNRMDSVGVGCTERVDAGLSMFGVEVVKHCNALGVIVDVSHCGHLTTMDACRYSKQPVNANHTCAKALNSVARAKADEALQAIAATGGVIGVVAVPFFLSAQRQCSVEAMLDHIDYIATLVGWRHVAIGTDWPMQAPDDVLIATLQGELRDLGFRDEDKVDVTSRLVGFDDSRDLPNITRGLVKRGYSDEQIKGILGENALRVFGEVCG